MTQFGLVTEGESDYVVLKSILRGFFTPDLLVTPKHPLRDETDKDRATGGWTNLRTYLKSEAFRGAFQSVEYIVVQIDTDVGGEYGVSARDHAGELSVASLVEKTCQKLIEWIGEDFYSMVKGRIIFAISVHEIECWLLPIYFENDKKKMAKTTGCINTLNQVLPQREGFSIHAKEYRFYERMSKPFLKRKDLDKFYPHNPSFAIFIDKLKGVHLDTE